MSSVVLEGVAARVEIIGLLDRTQMFPPSLKAGARGVLCSERYVSIRRIIMGKDGGTYTGRTVAEVYFNINLRDAVVVLFQGYFEAGLRKIHAHFRR